MSRGLQPQGLRHSRRAFLLIPLPISLLGQGGDALARLAQEIFTSINRERQQRGLRPLRWSAPLAEEARTHAQAMARDGFFSHADPRRGTFAERMRQAGLRRAALAENLFTGRGQPDRVATAVTGWLRSPGHRANLLNPRYDETGTGAALAPDGTYYFTQVFAASSTRR